MVSQLVFDFMDAVDTQRLESIRDSHRVVRTLVQSEIRGCVEFINVNGRLYRYGFISTDTDRSRECVQALTPSLQEFNRIFKTHLSSWSEFSPFELKNHLQKNPNPEVHRLLPAPVPAMNPSTLEWLKGVYVSLHRLNSHWGTHFKQWGDVQVDPRAGTQQQALKGVTEEDMAELQTLMKKLTQHAMAGVDKPPTNYHDVTNCTHAGAKELKQTHGVVELLFACITKKHGRDPVNMYMNMLLYLARSRRKDSFSPLPPGKHHVHGAETNAFISGFYSSEKQLERDWGKTDPALQLPMSSVKSQKHFQELVHSV